MDKEGKILNIFDRRAYRVMEEFGFNVSEMASAIESYRDEITELQKELESAKDTTD